MFHFFAQPARQVYAMYTPYYPFRGVEFICLCISTLMVLHRLLKHTLDQNRHAAVPDVDRTRHTTGDRNHKAALIGGLSTVSTRTMDFFKFISLIIMSFGVVGICCGLADAVFYDAQKRHLESAAEAANATSGKGTEDSKKFKMYNDAAALLQANSRSAQHFCEVNPPPPSHPSSSSTFSCSAPCSSPSRTRTHRSSPSTSSSSCSSLSATAGERLSPLL
jgi:hypothetical protein